MSALNEKAARLIAFYLPQYHPIPENDAWWGKGFTEWTNTAKARPLFRGHYQPHIPADLGFYDLRLPEVREAQAAMAREYGIDAFCYYHYWFAGKRLLEKPFDEVLHSGKPDFPFCLCWANQSWTGVWHGVPDRMLIQQTYPGTEDHCQHFEYLLPAFRDPRYFRVDGKPLFLIYQPSDLPQAVIGLWQQMARDAGLPGLYLIGINNHSNESSITASFDGVLRVLMPKLARAAKDIPTLRKPLAKLSALYREWRHLPTIHKYQTIMGDLLAEERLNGQDCFPCAIPNWDNTPRCGPRGRVLHGSSPELFQEHFSRAIDQVMHHPESRRLVFIKSWNEWAEGNHLEPDLRFGKKYLEAIRTVLAQRAMINR